MLRTKTNVRPPGIESRGSPTARRRRPVADLAFAIAGLVSLGVLLVLAGSPALFAAEAPTAVAQAAPAPAAPKSPEPPAVPGSPGAAPTVPPAAPAAPAAPPKYIEFKIPTGDGPALGPKDAKVTILHYLDYQ